MPNTRDISATPEASDPSTGVRKRWALVIGANRYIDPTIATLSYAVNDAIELERLLTTLGYKVQALHDQAGSDFQPTLTTIDHWLTRVCASAMEDDLILVYFAGHGMLQDGESVLIPVDVRREQIHQNALRVAAIERRLRDCPARRRVLLLDACHAGVDLGRSIHDPNFIRDVYDLAEGTALLAASSARQIAQEGEHNQQHGLFTYYLLEGLSGSADNHKGFVTFDDLRKHVLAGVRKWNFDHRRVIQEPTSRVEGVGDIILADYRGQPSATYRRPSKPRSSVVFVPAYEVSALVHPLDVRLHFDGLRWTISMKNIDKTVLSSVALRLRPPATMSIGDPSLKVPHLTSEQTTAPKRLSLAVPRHSEAQLLPFVATYFRAGSRQVEQVEGALQVLHQ